MAMRTLLALLALVAPPAAAEAARPGPLVSSDWLAANREQATILDVRADHVSFGAEGHIPGAALVAWPSLRLPVAQDAAQPAALDAGRQALVRIRRQTGAAADSLIVLAHRGLAPEDTLLAVRLYGLLKSLGHEAVAVLDGGTAAWAAAGRPLAKGPAVGDRSQRAAQRVLAGQGAGEAGLIERQRQRPAGARPAAGSGTRPRLAGATSGEPCMRSERDFDFRLLFAEAKPARLRPLSELRGIMAEFPGDLQRPEGTDCGAREWAGLAWFILFELAGGDGSLSHPVAGHDRLLPGARQGPMLLAH